MQPIQFTKSIVNFTDTEKLLYLILQELQKINEFLSDPKQSELVSDLEPVSVRPVRKVTEEKVNKANKANKVKEKASKEATYDPKNRSKSCKKCGKKFTAWGDFIKHMQEHAKVAGKE
ncbi:MAG: hypothetical protein A4E53_00149 [Pelotomaculum sp. PtaB.Bin104]|nr:MAG: hypothetical protein A4E53_00149 [Pelotomaculum sp. PtaB.Bin104]